MSKISLFNSLPKKGEKYLSTGTLDVEEFIGFIKFGKWQKQTEFIRSFSDKKERNKHKLSIPKVTISGVFHERSEANLITHSGFICIDVDGFNDKALLYNDPYIYAMFYSVSGLGLAIIIKVDASQHKECFNWLRKYFFEKYGIVIDNAPQNVASTRDVSYDPEVEIKKNSKVSKVLIEPKRPKSLPIIISGDKINEYINECATRGLNIADNYFDYVNLSFAISNGFNESGRKYFHLLASQSSKYNEKQADTQYNTALKRTKNGITVGTLYYMLKQAGIDIKGENNNLLPLVLVAKKSNKSKEIIINQLVKLNENLTIDEATNFVNSVNERPELTLNSSSSDPDKLIENLIIWTKQNHNLKLNLITGFLDDDGVRVTERKLNTIYLRSRQAFNSNAITFDLLNRTILSDFTPEFHPIFDYIEANKYRTSTGNIDRLVKTIETDSAMSGIFIRKWIISIIASLNYKVVRSTLVLLGGQNTGKTEWFRLLLPEKLKEYYGESKLDRGKDDEILMCQKLILMNDEMGGKNRADEKLFKEMVSKSVFSLRAPYGKHNEDFKRLAILCGTSNEYEIMNDPTGNTRLLPVVVKSINHALYNSIDKDELFMEAYRLYEAGEEWKLNKFEIEQLMTVSKSFEVANNIYESIDMCFIKPRGAMIGEDLTTTQIRNHIELNTTQRNLSMKLLGQELKKFFGESKNSNGKRTYKVVRVGVASNPINNNNNNEENPF